MGKRKAGRSVSSAVAETSHKGLNENGETGMREL
jgi:hypothetical protein